MKTSLILGIVSVALGFAALANNTKGEDKTKISIIHCEGNQIQVHDTIVDSASGYTAEQFIQAKGFDAEKVEIIHTKGYHGLITHLITPEVWFMNDEVMTEDFIFQEFSDRPTGEKTFMKKVVIEGSPNSDGIPQKHIVLIDGTQELVIGDSAITNRNFNVSIPSFQMNLDSLLLRANEANDALGTSQKIEVKKTINDDGDEETRVWIDGKEVSHTILNTREDIPNFPVRQGSLKDYNPSEHTKSPAVYKITEYNTSNAPQLPLFSGAGITGNRKPLTIALVTPLNDPTDDTDEPTRVSNENSQIDNLRFFPNPNEGRFRLGFNIQQEGRTSVRIYTVEGKEVYTDDLGRFSGAYEKEIDISHLGPGTYILNIVMDKHRVAEKLIVQ